MTTVSLDAGKKWHMIRISRVGKFWVCGRCGKKYLRCGVATNHVMDHVEEEARKVP